MQAQGLIRKISVNDMKNGITYSVGQPMVGGRVEITAIRLDVEGSEERGCAKYDIVVREADGTARIWKSIEGMPVAVEYDLEAEKDVEA